MTLIEQAPDLKADGLGENYKLLAGLTALCLPVIRQIRS